MFGSSWIKTRKKKNKPWTSRLKSRKNVRTSKKKNKPWALHLKSRKNVKTRKKKTLPFTNQQTAGLPV